MRLYEVLKGSVSKVIAKPMKNHKLGPVLGGVHKLQTFLKEIYKEMFQKSSAKNQGEPPVRP